MELSVLSCFNDLGLLRLGFEHPTFRLQGERSNQNAPKDATEPFNYNALWNLCRVYFKVN